MSNTKPQLRLVLDVRYIPEGVDVAELKRMLERMVKQGIGNGGLTGNTPAEVDEYSLKVIETSADLSEEELASFMADRIESGSLALEDIPVRLARYGLMEPDAFVAEMRERMDHIEEVLSSPNGPEITANEQATAGALQVESKVPDIKVSGDAGVSFNVPESDVPVIKFSCDGGTSFIVAPEGVRIVYENVMVPGEDGTGEFHLNCTHEGLISDVWVTREEPLDHNIGTRAQPLEDILSDLVEDNE